MPFITTSCYGHTLTFNVVFIKLCRLSKKEAELQKEDSNKASVWKTKASEFKQWLKGKENELENQGPVGTTPSIVKQQKAELEVLDLLHCRLLFDPDMEMQSYHNS